MRIWLGHEESVMSLSTNSSTSYADYADAHAGWQAVASQTPDYPCVCVAEDALVNRAQNRL